MKLSELIYVIVDNICVYKEKPKSDKDDLNVEYDDLYIGGLKNAPAELLNCNVRIIGAKKRDFIEIEIQ